jgi:hypothetical protein
MLLYKTVFYIRQRDTITNLDDIILLTGVPAALRQAHK